MIRIFLAGVAAVGSLHGLLDGAGVTRRSRRSASSPRSPAPTPQWGETYKREIDLYMFQHDGKDGNPKINLILRDAPGTDLARTKQVVQEFITRDNAAVVGGGEFTPEALAVAPIW